MAPDTISDALAVFSFTRIASLKLYGAALAGTDSDFSGTWRPRTVKIRLPGRRKREAVSSAASTIPPGLFRRSRINPSRRSPPSFSIAAFRSGAVFPSKLETRMSDAGGCEKRALHARRLHLLGRQSEVQDARHTAAAHIELRLPLARLRQQLGQLFDIEAADDVPVNTQDFIARRQPGLGGGRARHRLEHDHAPGQQRNHAAEALLRGGLHFLELLELPGVEKDRVRIERPQQPGDRALIKRLLGRDRVGGVLLQDGIRLDDRFHLRGEILGRQGGRAANQRCYRATKHLSGQIVLISTWTWGNSRGFSVPWVRTAQV